MLGKRLWLCFSQLIPVLLLIESAVAAPSPNVIVILADDMGAADWSGGGSRFIDTPNLDQLAAEGTTLTRFYASANVCTPSRAGLLTGRYPVRTGLATGVIRQWSDYGLPAEELTIAELLSDAGYRTALIGKWHLGTSSGSHPLEHGFQEFFGVPYSNDMRPFPLLRGREEIETEAPQAELTARYTQEAVEFIERAAASESPFFLYLAHTFPHVPLYASETFKGTSAAGRYGDAIEEIDWSLGRLREVISATGLADQTLIIFTSDNGPWFQGDSGVRGRKGDTYDGAYRVPFVAYVPGVTNAGARSAGIAMNIDILPTVVSLLDLPLPEGRVIDGRDMTPLLRGEEKSLHKELLFFLDDKIAALRTARWSYVVSAFYRELRVPLEKFNAALLFDVAAHGDELFDVSADHPGVVADLRGRLESYRTRLEGLPQKVTPYPRPAAGES